MAYLDTSAFLKPTLGEGEADALREFLRGWHRFASSELLVTEAVRAARRRGPESEYEVRLALGGVSLTPVDSFILRRAAVLDPPVLRTLDAIHLATAELLGAELGVFVTYDERLAAGARALGMAVAAPA